MRPISCRIPEALLTLICLASLCGCETPRQQVETHSTAVAARIFATQTASAPSPIAAPMSTTAPLPTAPIGQVTTATLLPPTTPLPSVATLAPTQSDILPSPRDIFAAVSPSVVYIENPVGVSGSGFLTHDGYIVTNAHVVFPARQVRVVFPNGEVHEETPVVNWDLVADLALVGPIRTSIPTLTLASGQNLPIGSNVYLIGYPGEVESNPQPSMTGGMISRRRSWDAIGMTFLQTDAATAGGQSGGVLVSETGAVIGISGFRFSEAQFCLVSAADDVAPRLEALLHTQLTVPSRSGGQRDWVVSLADSMDEQVFYIEESKGTRIYLTAEGEGDVALSVSDPTGWESYWVDNDLDGHEELNWIVRMDTPYLVTIRQYDDEPFEYQIHATCPLVPFEDEDDGHVLSIDSSFQGTLAHANDRDRLCLDLEAGQAVDLVVESMLFDPTLYVTFEGATNDEGVYDDDHGGGIFQHNAALTFVAPHAGRFEVIVSPYSSFWGYDVSFGGYILSTKAAAPEHLPTPNAMQTVVAALSPQNAAGDGWTTYSSPLYPFEIDYPAWWQRSEEISVGYSAVFLGDSDAQLYLAEDNLIGLGLGQMDLDVYCEWLTGWLTEHYESVDLHIEGVEPLLSDQVPSAKRITYTYGDRLAQRAVVVYDAHIALGAEYDIPQALQPQLQDLIDTSFASLRLAFE